MRPFRAFFAMILFVTLFLVFLHSNLHSGVTYSHKATTGILLGPPSPEVQIQEREVITQSLQKERVTVQPTVAFNVAVSADFRKTIPQNQGYWNRLLYLALSKMDKGEIHSGIYSNWSHCKEKNQELLRTNVHDFNSYSDLFKDFVEGINCRNSPIVINQPQKCLSGGVETGNQTFLLFGIKSNPENFVQRQALRETWAREEIFENGQRLRTVFLIGSPKEDDPDLSTLLSTEATHFGDILQWDFHESFLNLTLKMNMFLQWTLEHCPHVNFVFSGDDDVFVNTPFLLGYLRSLDASKASKLYVGHVIKTASPLRDPKSKYFIPVSFYDGPYTAYVGGGGFIFSGALLKPLYLVSQIIPFYPIDDVYTGMCAKAIGVSPEAHGGFYTFDIKQVDRENLCVYKGLILTHQRSPQQIKKLWRGIHSPLLTC